jgi:hypothetical protein
MVPELGIQRLDAQIEIPPLLAHPDDEGSHAVANIQRFAGEHLVERPVELPWPLGYSVAAFQ